MSDRRHFLEASILVTGTGMALALGLPGAAFLLTPLRREEERTWVDLGHVEDLTEAETPIALRFNFVAWRGYVRGRKPGLLWIVPDAEDPINATWVRPLLHDLARGKTVDASRPPTDAGWAQFDNVRKIGSLELHHSNYLQPEADAIVAIYNRCLPVMEELLGVPPSAGMMSALLLLPTGGGGFSSGHKIGLGVWWGGFPDREYGMLELIGHEGTHSWVLPFAEPMWNEALATYVGAHVAVRLGLPEDGMRVINGAIERARKDDPEMTKWDIAHGDGVPNAVVWGKTMWIWEQMRAEKPDILARYFRAKRRLADPDTRDAYTPNDCVAVLSHAMERDLFSWFRSLGLTVSAEEATIAVPAAQADHQ